MQRRRWMGVLTLALMAAVSCAATVPSDTTDIRQGQIVKLGWWQTHTPDLDHFNFYVFNPDSELVQLVVVRSWDTTSVNDSTFEGRWTYRIPLEPGLYFGQLSAEDVSGNESDLSNEVWFRVWPPKPPAPMHLYIEVIEPRR